MNGMIHQEVAKCTKVFSDALGAPRNVSALCVLRAFVVKKNSSYSTEMSIAQEIFRWH